MINDLNIIEKYINKFYDESIYEQLFQKKIYFYIKKKKYFKLDDEEYVKYYECKKIKNINNTVWTCWLQGIENAPDIVKKCIESVKKSAQLNKKKYVLITKENLHEFIELPPFILEKYVKGFMCNAHFSDIIRIMLIKIYGGTWIDATVFVPDNIPKYMLDDFFMFKQSGQLREVRKIGNWWISARTNDKIIHMQCNAMLKYWEKEKKAKHYYVFHIMWSLILDENKELKEMWNKRICICTDNTHILSKKLNQKFDLEEWQTMLSVSPVFKLSYKLDFVCKENTYYSKLINDLLVSIK